MQVQKGDIILWAIPEEKAQAQRDWRMLLIPTLEYMAFDLKIYEPVFPGIDTLCGKPNLFPQSQRPYINERLLFHHIEIAAETGEYVEKEGNIYIILRLKPEQTLFPLDIDKMVEIYTAPLWSRYVLPVFSAFIRMVYKPELWPWLEQPALFKWYNELFGLGEGVPEPLHVRWSQAVSEGNHDAHTDILSPLFFTRTFGCSTRVAWSIVMGWQERTGVARDYFYRMTARVNAIDSLSPGQVGDILIKGNAVDVIIP
jgi:hypothetical protein